MRLFSAAVVLAAVVLPAGLAAESAQAAYYRNGLAVDIAGRTVSGLNRVAVYGGGPVFTLRWTTAAGADANDSGYGASFCPVFAYFGQDGAPLAVSAAPRLMAAGPFVSDRALALAAEREALYGYLGTDGAWAIPPRFAEAGDFSDGVAAAREPGGQWGTIGPDGSWLLAPIYRVVVLMPGSGVAAVRGQRDASDRYVDAKTGAAVPPDSPRLAAPAPRPDYGFSRYPSAAAFGGLKLAEVRRGSVSGSEFTRYVKIAAPDGRVLSSGVFNDLLLVEGNAAVVALGYYGDYWGDGPTTNSFSVGQGAFGLYDPVAGKFLIPPACGQILPAGDGRWYARTHGGSAGYYDASGRQIGPAPNFPVLWFSGSVACGLDERGGGGDRLPAGQVAIGGMVNDDKVRLRAAPATTGAIVAELAKGTRLTVREFKPEVETIGGWTGIWMRAELKDGRAGWVFGYFVDLYYYAQ
jgi:hypothetical protein